MILLNFKKRELWEKLKTTKRAKINLKLEAKQGMKMKFFKLKFQIKTKTTYGNLSLKILQNFSLQMKMGNSQKKLI